MHRQGRPIWAALGAAALTLSVTACGGTAEPKVKVTAEPPSHEAETNAGDVPPEPPYETELDLSPEEKEAADEAYDTYVSFVRAEDEVSVDGGEVPERALIFLRGSLKRVYAEGFKSMSDEGEALISGYTHTFHRVEKVDYRQDGDASVIFESCVDFRHADLLDRRGESLFDKSVTSSLGEVVLRQRDEVWKVVDMDFSGDECL